MVDSQITRNYLAEMNAILIETKIIVQREYIGDTISVNKRDYFRKRNGKMCYVDYAKKHFPTDWSRIKTYTNHRTYSTGDNDWNPLHTSTQTYKFLDGYKDELIAKFLQTTEPQ